MLERLKHWSVNQADVIMALAVACSRLVPHPDNVTPLGALWLFAGAQFERRRSLVLIPLLALVLSDLLLGYYFVWPYVYASYGLSYLLGRWALQGKIRGPRLVATTLFSSLLFYGITNFGEWWHSSLYPHTGVGLVACYVAALPFFRNSLIGDLVYTGILFASYAIFERSQRRQMAFERLSR